MRCSSAPMAFGPLSFDSTGKFGRHRLTVGFTPALGRMAIRCAYGVHTGLLQRLALPATAPRPAPNELQQGTVRTRHRNGRSSVTARGWPWSSRRGRSGSGVFPRLASTAWGGGGPDQPSPSGPRTSGARTTASGGHPDPTGRVPGVPGLAPPPPWRIVSREYSPRTMLTRIRLLHKRVRLVAICCSMGRATKLATPSSS
jgi:hypothetical protein